MSEDAADEIAQLLAQLTPEAIENMSYEELLAQRNKLNPYGRTIEGSNNYLTFSYTNLQENYMMRLLMTSMIGFLNRMVDEWHVPNGIPPIPVYDYARDPSLLTSFHKDWKMTDQTKRDIAENEKWMAKRVVVKEFLEDMFQYNPDRHVRSAYKAQPKDTVRKIIDTPAANLSTEEWKRRNIKFKEQMLEYDRIQQVARMASDEVRNAEPLSKVAHLLDETKTYDQMDFSTWSNEDKNLLREVYNMIPPADIFHRINYYKEANYDKLREAVLHLYCDKPDFDIAINPYSWHSTREEAQEFQKKHKDEVIADIIIADSGKWCFHAPFAKVRDTMRYFNDKTIVLEEIMNQIENDSKMGAELMKKRVIVEKKKNEEEAGPDSEAFLKWKAQNSSTKQYELENANANSYVDENCPDNSVQVDVFRLSEGGGKLEKTHFFTEAEAPNISDQKN